MYSLRLMFTIATLPHNNRLKHGLYHYPKMRNADAVIDAVSDKYKFDGRGIDTDEDTVGFHVEAQVDFEHVQQLSDGVQQIVDDITGRVSGAADPTQAIWIGLKDVYHCEMDRFGAKYKPSLLGPGWEDPDLA
jgi:hypothetical protein